uniref:Uncharacterized protein n=1 Tax=Steinernema glaseri TaxID=37863 RepID=A0A1I8AIN2_9BILA
MTDAFAALGSPFPTETLHTTPARPPAASQGEESLAHIVVFHWEGYPAVTPHSPYVRSRKSRQFGARHRDDGVCDREKKFLGKHSSGRLWSARGIGSRHGGQTVMRNLEWQIGFCLGPVTESFVPPHDGVRSKPKTELETRDCTIPPPEVDSFSNPSFEAFRKFL